MCVGHHYPQANTNNVNMTRALLQTTGDKDEPNIVCMRNSQHGTQNVKTHNRRTQNTKKMSNTDLDDR
jgi:fructose/tagatose bisphosphate aldolase